jgi:hypothetical protein
MHRNQQKEAVFESEKGYNYMCVTTLFIFVLISPESVKNFLKRIFGIPI